jgi:hypothetical protein
MKLEAGEITNAWADELKKTQGLSLPKPEKVGNAKVPEKVMWLRAWGYRLKDGKAVALGALAG